ncbi:MAG: hypothetical protein Q7R32_02330 [Dehalococcoidia bacterium]|nr:hypothetical protein [Dehalococcoidia bacterium]
MAKLVCPHCEVATALIPTRITGTGILHDYSSPGHRQQGTVTVSAIMEPQTGHHFAIAECAGCKALFVAVKEQGSYGDWVTAWPMPQRTVAEEIPSPVREAFRDALTSLSAGSLGGCLLMCRTTLIRLQRQQGVSSLLELRDKGTISDMLYQQADEVRLWANVVGHEDFESGALTSTACEELVLYIEALLEAVYVQPARLDKLRSLRKQGKKGNPD